MLVVTRSLIRNPSILEVRQLPRKIFGRVTVWPKGQGGIGVRVRIVAEFQLLRYSLALSPLILLLLVWNDSALALSQAPIPMIMLIWWVETRVLRVPDSRKARLIASEEAERGLDHLKIQAREALTRIAAGRGMASGALHLVVEQSELWVLPPLTYVSVQSEEGPEVLDLTEAEVAVLRETLFRPPLTERMLQRINQSQDVYLRDITLDARSVSAHARLEAALA